MTPSEKNKGEQERESESIGGRIEAIKRWRDS